MNGWGLPNPDAHIIRLLEQGSTVEMPDDLRAEHQPDPQRLSQGTQCVCMCGAQCVSYVGHLQEVVEHRELWDRLCAERGHPLEAFIRAGVNPYRNMEPL